MPSVHNLIKESSAKHSTKHKSILKVEIKSAMDLTVILMLDWSLFQEKFGDAVSKPRQSVDVEMLRTIMETNISDYLIRLPILENILYLKLETLARVCRYSVKKAGQVICGKGDMGDYIYIVLKGEVKAEAKVDILDTKKDMHPSPMVAPRKLSMAFQCDQSHYQSHLTTPAHFHTTTSCQKEAFKNALSCSTNLNENTMTKMKEKNIDILKQNQTVELARFGVGDYFGRGDHFEEVSTLPCSATVTAITNVLMALISKTDIKILYHSMKKKENKTDTSKKVKRIIDTNTGSHRYNTTGQNDKKDKIVVVVSTTLSKNNGILYAEVVRTLGCEAKPKHNTQLSIDQFTRRMSPRLQRQKSIVATKQNEQTIYKKRKFDQSQGKKMLTKKIQAINLPQLQLGG